MRKFYRSMRSWIGVAVIMATMAAAVPVSFALDGGGLPDLDWSELGAGSSLPVPFNKVISSGTVHSGDQVCVAKDSIAASQVQVLSGGELNFYTQYASGSDPATHHRKITLGTGFRASEGSVFRARTGVAEVGQISHDPCSLFDANVVGNLEVMPLAGIEGFSANDVSIFVGQDTEKLVDILSATETDGMLFFLVGPLEDAVIWTTDVADIILERQNDPITEFVGKGITRYIRDNPLNSAEVGACTFGLDGVCDGYYFLKGEDFQGNELSALDRKFSGVAIFLPVGGVVLSKANEAYGIASKVIRTGQKLESVLPLIKRYIPNTKVVDVVEGSADTANEWFRVERNYHLGPYKAGSKIVEFQLEEATKFVRFYDGVNAGAAGQWMMRAEEVVGLTPLQIKDKFALSYVPTFKVDVTVPQGTKLRAGEAAPIFGGAGGGNQIDLMGQENVGETFTNAKPI